MPNFYESIVFCWTYFVRNSYLYVRNRFNRDWPVHHLILPWLNESSFRSILDWSEHYSIKHWLDGFHFVLLWLARSQLILSYLARTSLDFVSMNGHLLILTWLDKSPFDPTLTGRNMTFYFVLTARKSTGFVLGGWINSRYCFDRLDQY